MKNHDATLARRIREVREELGLSQEELARRMRERGHADFRQQTIYKIEKDESPRRVTYGEAVDLAAALGYTPEGLAGGGEGILVAHGAVASAAAQRLQLASSEYASALLKYSITADELGGELREDVVRYLTRSVPNQTPAMLVRDAIGAVEAEMKRDNLSAGHYVKCLLAALRRDAEALEVLRTGIIVHPDTAELTATISMDEHLADREELLRSLFREKLTDPDG